MDDQNFGVTSRADAIRAVATLNASLGSYHLTPNSGKTKIMSLSDARRHFHLDINRSLDNIKNDSPRTAAQRLALGKAVRTAWVTAQPHANAGEWDKILKRFYMLAGRSHARFLRRHTLSHLLQYPTIAERIAEYVRCTGTVGEYLDFVDAATAHAEQQYDDVNVRLLEECLRLEPDSTSSARLRALVIAVLKGKVGFVGHQHAHAIACLMLLRYGDRRFISHFRTAIEESIAGRRDVALARSAAIVLSSYGKAEFEYVRSELARLGRSTLGLVVSLIAKLVTWTSVPDRFKARLDLRYDSMRQMPFVDTRSLLTARLLGLNNHPGVQAWLTSNRTNWNDKAISEFDRALIRRLHPNH
jgi:hypothetical protein